MYLVRAPVPRGQDGDPQGHAGPGQVPGDGVSEQVHGVVTWQVTRTVGNDLTGHRQAIDLLQVTVASNLVEGCGPGAQSFHYCPSMNVHTLVHVCLYIPKIVRVMAPMIMINVCRVSV